MPITAETFELDHFDRLARGIEVASQAFELRSKETEEAKQQLDEAESAIHKLEEELADARALLHDQEKLVEFIRDVERGVRSTDELFTYVRETYE